MLAMTASPIQVIGVHPISFVLLGTYVLGLCMVANSQKSPMWNPRWTPETRADHPKPSPNSRTTILGIWLKFGLCGGIVALSGFLVARTGIALSAKTGISEAIVGALFTAICTSLPELVTSVAAVRRGALTLAVGGIIGGNCFDVLFVSFADFAYRDGSIYHAISQQQTYLTALAILLTGILLMGLLRREKHGIANIGFESFLLLAVYAAAVVLFTVSGYWSAAS
jgi:cation:H+ antiporter